MNSYKPYEYSGKTMLIERYVVLGEKSCTIQEYDMFSLRPDTEIKSLLEQEIDLSDYRLFADKDREYYNSFKYLSEPQNKKYYLYTAVYSKTRTKIIVNIAAAKAKMWINGECISIHPEHNLTNCYLTAKLNKGQNHILLEVLCFKADNRFSLQIRNYKHEMENNVDSLSQVSHAIEIDPFVLVHDYFYQPQGNRFKFMYFKNNNSDFNSEYEVELLDSEVGIVKMTQGRLNESQEIDLAILRGLSTETFRLERVLCKMVNSNGEITKKYFCVFLNNYLDRVAGIVNELLFEAGKHSPEIYSRACGEVKRLEKSLSVQNYIVGYWDLRRCYEILQSIKNKTTDSYSYKKPGIHQIYIHSEIDDSYVKIGVRVPSEYDEMKKYPVFIAISSAGEGTFSQKFPPESEIDERCLCFDVTGRGYTAGSYIGQASIMEILCWIKNNYSVNEDRIYFVGYSNGGFATFSIAQNFPHIPAAIYPLAGYPQIETVKNISNIPTYQIVSPNDYLFAGKENKVKKALKKYGNYHQYNFRQMNHSDLSVYLYHKKILNEMLKFTRNPYPRTVRYKTCRNRNLRSFWIELHSIAKGKQFGEIKAEIIDSKTINLTASGITGLTITIPPQINKSQFNIVINRKVISFNDYHSEKVILERRKCWRLADEQDKTDVCKGTGLLDVYLNKLKIIVPENPSELLTEVSRRFAQPHTNGFIPKVFANFPVYTERNIPDNIFDNNLIIFDVDNKNTFMKELGDIMAVRYDRFGFEYQKSIYKKDYVIMQSVANPYNSNLSILAISTNNEKLLQTHVLLRKVIIPTYINGMHKFWNNEIIIYDGEQYFTAYERDIKLRKM